MGTKNNPGKYDCYAAAGPDEPMFILLARDPIAPALVDLWAAIRDAQGCPDHSHRSHSDKTKEARALANDMRAYRTGSHPITLSPALFNELRGAYLSLPSNVIDRISQADFTTLIAKALDRSQ